MIYIIAIAVLSIITLGCKKDTGEVLFENLTSKNSAGFGIQNGVERDIQISQLSRGSLLKEGNSVKYIMQTPKKQIIEFNLTKEDKIIVFIGKEEFKMSYVDK